MKTKQLRLEKNIKNYTNDVLLHNFWNSQMGKLSEFGDSYVVGVCLVCMGVCQREYVQGSMSRAVHVCPGLYVQE